MGLFDQLGAALGQKLGEKLGAAQADKVYGDKYQKYVGVDFTFDLEEYPEGTELLQDFMEDLDFYIQQNDAAGKAFLAKNFILGTLGEDVYNRLSKMYDNLGNFLDGHTAYLLAMTSDGKNGKFRTLLLSDGLKDLTDGKFTQADFIDLWNAVNQVVTSNDIRYIEWNGAALYNPDLFKDMQKVRKLAMFDKNGDIFVQKEVAKYQKAVKDDLKEFYRRGFDREDALLPMAEWKLR